MPHKSWYAAQIRDEKQAIKTYRKHGYHKLAKDEKRHLKFLRKEKKRLQE